MVLVGARFGCSRASARERSDFCEWLLASAREHSDFNRRLKSEHSRALASNHSQINRNQTTNQCFLRVPDSLVFLQYNG